MGESDDGHITQLEHKDVMEKHMGTSVWAFRYSTGKIKPSQAQNKIKNIILNLNFYFSGPFNHVDPKNHLANYILIDFLSRFIIICNNLQ